MSDDDQVREDDRLGEDQAATTGSDATDKPVAPPAPQVRDLRLNDEVRAYLRGIVADLEEFGGIGVARIRRIALGEEPTNGELEELGYVFVGLLRGLAASSDASQGQCSETSSHS